MSYKYIPSLMLIPIRITMKMILNSVPFKFIWYITILTYAASASIQLSLSIGAYVYKQGGAPSIHA